MPSFSFKSSAKDRRARHPKTVGGTLLECGCTGRAKECRPWSSVDSDLEAFSPNRKNTADGSAGTAARPWVRLGGSSRTERNDCLDGQLFYYTDQYGKTNLSHDGLDPAHVPCRWVNNPALGDFCVAMIGRADIEGSKSNVATNAWLPQASYPRGNLSDTSCSTLGTPLKRIDRPRSCGRRPHWRLRSSQLLPFCSTADFRSA